MGGDTTEEVSPVMPIGKYFGAPVNKLPLHYCKWILTQGFSSEIMEAAQKRIDQYGAEDQKIVVSLHAIDQFSVRFGLIWTLSSQYRNRHMGIATFLLKYASIAWHTGEEVSKNRHDKDGIIKELDGIKYVFNSKSQQVGGNIELITVM